MDSKSISQISSQSSASRSTPVVIQERKELPEDSKKNEEIITVISSDGKRYQGTRLQFKLSKLIEIMKLQDEKEMEFPINVESNILSRIISYLEHHNGIAGRKILIPLRTLDLSKLTDEWDYNFISDFTQDELVKLFDALNYMDIQDCLLLACARFASFIKGKSKEKIASLFAEKKIGKHIGEASGDSKSAMEVKS